MAKAQRNRSKPVKLEGWWWQAAPDPAAAPSAVAIARHRALQEQLLHFDQNAWLAKHAKQPRFRFSGEQKRMLRQWFDALDSDGSGKISVEELEDPMLSIGIVTDTREIEQIVSKLDKDANGQIDFQEFVDFLTPHARHNKGASPQKHEVMFHQLTKKMEHQSSGFLEVNTQLSMERRRFILDSITSFTSQSIQEDLAELKHFKEERSPVGDSTSPGRSRHRRAMTKKAKLAALAARHQEELRFQALEQVFIRNSASKRFQAMPTSMLGTPGASRRSQRRLDFLTPLPAVERPPATPKRSSIVASPRLEYLDARRASAKLLEQSGMGSYRRLLPTSGLSSSMPNLPAHTDAAG
ncbi:Ca2+-binding protein/EF-hand superfamily protein [Phytophthora cinnamomi]|uniref:Ca2+-binding protein/EF-hand superfamily protein n=1 Tax=Phytophthora cinnamomi TaxID=4785 RepID=UPI00355AB193|nr:Ca2+-binding protein/EF-hand superfamily protein [Phytophthora cinnamomi]